MCIRRNKGEIQMSNKVIAILHPYDECVELTYMDDEEGDGVALYCNIEHLNALINQLQVLNREAKKDPDDRICSCCGQEGWSVDNVHAKGKRIVGFCAKCDDQDPEDF
jgi:hypothetical protein